MTQQFIKIVQKKGCLDIPHYTCWHCQKEVSVRNPYRHEGGNKKFYVATKKAVEWAPSNNLQIPNINCRHLRACDGGGKAIFNRYKEFKSSNCRDLSCLWPGESLTNQQFRQIRCHLCEETWIETSVPNKQRLQKLLTDHYRYKCPPILETQKKLKDGDIGEECRWA